MRSNVYASELDALLAKIGDDNVHAKVFSHLIAFKLLEKLSGEQQLETAHSLVNAIGVQNIGHADLTGEVCFYFNPRLTMVWGLMVCLGASRNQSPWSYSAKTQ
jgi:hypothetical protein